ncbi:MAG: hypothetical protein PHU85_18785, partial [Phycisphaerae bacterium]|nr:hypothetical protein [Phycisphaerae bacterium]
MESTAELERQHRFNVESAVTSGKPVPPEVLADYADQPWAKKGETAPATTPPQAQKGTEKAETPTPDAPAPTLSEKAKAARADFDKSVEDLGKLLSGRTPMAQMFDPKVIKQLAVTIGKGIKAGGYSLAEGLQAAHAKLSLALGPEKAQQAIDEAAELIRREQWEETTAIKNAAVDAAREKRGLEPVAKPTRQSKQGWLDEAKAKMEADPLLADRLIEKFRADPANLSPVEIAILNTHRRTITNAYEKATDAMFKATDAGDTTAAAEAKQSVADYDAKLQAMEQATEAAGTEWGRSGVARQIELRRDYTLANMVRRWRVANEGKAPNDQQLAVIKQQADQITDLQQRLQAAEAKTAELAAQHEIDRKIIEAKRKAATARVARPPGDRRMDFRARNRIFTADKANEALKRFHEKMSSMRSTTNVGADIGAAVSAAKELVYVAASYAEAGVRNFAKFSADVMGGLNEAQRKSVEPHLKGAWDKGVAEYETQRRKAMSEGMKRELAAGSPLTGMGRWIQKLAESFVAEGVTNREALIDAVHSALKQVDPEITRRQTMDAISGYGDFKPLDKNAIKAKLRDLKGQMQQVGKLEDMQQGQAPAKTGVERRVPSDEERRLIQQVNDAKRRGGFTVTDPEAQLKSTLDSLKTRLRNQISDLNLQLATGEKIVRDKAEVPTDAEVAGLRTQRDALKEQYDAMFPTDRELTDAQRVKMATAAVEKSIAEYERRIKEKDTAPAQKGTVAPETPELAALRARRDALKAELDELRDAAKPTVDPEARAHKAFKTRTLNRIAELLERLDKGDFSQQPETVKPQKLEHEYLKVQLEQVKRRFEEGVFKQKMANRSRLRKVVDLGAEGLNLSRAVLTSMDLSAVLRQGGFVTLGHPVMGARAFTGTLRAVRRSGADAVRLEIQNRPNAALYKRAGLHLSEEGGPLANMEEAYMSRHADKIPGVGASQRVYVAFLNRLRADLFDSMVKGLGDNGQVSLEEAKAVANYVNVATGRGSFKNTSTAAVFSTTLFSPRLWASRIQLLMGQPAWRGSWRTRKLVAAEYARFLGGLAVVYGVAHL